MYDTKTDLEQVLELLEQGWCQYRTLDGSFGNKRTLGIGGGCLGEIMAKVACQSIRDAEVLKRYDNMAEAMGFGRPNQGHNLLVDLGESMIDWNDFVADWMSVKELVKKTIGEL